MNLNFISGWRKICKRVSVNLSLPLSTMKEWPWRKKDEKSGIWTNRKWGSKKDHANPRQNIDILHKKSRYVLFRSLSLTYLRQKKKLAVKSRSLLINLVVK